MVVGDKTRKSILRVGATPCVRAVCVYVCVCAEIVQASTLPSFDSMVQYLLICALFGDVIKCITLLPSTQVVAPTLGGTSL
jgi:hypothetical protein